jgi:hypothetical protein
MTQEVALLPSKHEALIANPVPPKRREEKYLKQFFLVVLNLHLGFRVCQVSALLLVSHLQSLNTFNIQVLSL